MQEQSQLDITLNQITQIIHLADGQSIFEYAFIVFITFMIGKFISSFAKGFFTRTIATLFGLSLVSDSFRIAGFTITSGLILGVGFLTPHFMYYFNYLLITVFKVQRFTINTYYIFITVWYKVRRFFNWIGSFFIKEKKSSFGTDNRSRNQGRSSSNSSNNEEAYQEYAKQNYQKEEKRERSQRQRKRSSSSNSNSNHSSSSNSSYTDTSYTSANTLEDKLKKDSQYAQFFSSSHSIVLGVDSSMSFKEIKKVYRKLVGIYHPDLNPDNEEVCTLITQRLNTAYEYFQKQQS